MLLTGRGHRDETAEAHLPAAKSSNVREVLGLHGEIDIDVREV